MLKRRQVHVPLNRSYILVDSRSLEKRPEGFINCA